MVLVTSGLFRKVGTSWLSIKVGIRGVFAVLAF